MASRRSAVRRVSPRARSHSTERSAATWVLVAFPALSRSVRSWAQPLKVGCVVDPTVHVLHGEVPHLTFDPSPVQRDRALGRPEGRHHPGDHSLVDRDPGHLREDRGLPGLVAETRLGSPVRTGVEVELPVSAIVERTVAPEPATADAFEQPAEQVDMPAPVRSPTPRLRTPDLLDLPPELVRHRRTTKGSIVELMPRLYGTAITVIALEDLLHLVDLVGLALDELLAPASVSVRARKKPASRRATSPPVIARFLR